MTGYADHPDVMDPAWSAFWIYVESCVAIIMASVRAVHPFFVNRDRGKEADEERNRVPLPMNGKRLLKRSEKLVRLGWEEMDREGQNGASLATLTRIHRFLYDDAHLVQESEPVQSQSLFTWP